MIIGSNPVTGKILSLPGNVYIVSGTHPTPYLRGTGVVSQGYSGRDVTLTVISI
jgi:hypothetical protein